MRENSHKHQPAAVSDNCAAPFDHGIFIDLDEQVIWIFGDASMKEQAGRKSKMLVNYPEFRIVLVTMSAGSRWNEHKTPSRILVNVLRGRVLFSAPHATFDLCANQLLTLDPGIVHSVSSTEDSAFLLTLFDPANP